MDGCFVLLQFMIWMVALTTFSIPVSEVGFRLSGAFLILICALLYRLYMQPSLPIEQVAYWSAMVSMSTNTLHGVICCCYKSR